MRNLQSLPSRISLLARCIVALILVLPVLILDPQTWRPASVAAAVTYYVDCTAGNDANSGTSTSQAWRTVARANRASLAPGDRLLLRRDCNWVGPLKASWYGTASAPILIGAYGTGALPKIHNGSSDLDDGYHNNVEITGAYQIIEYIEVTILNPPVHSGCDNNPIGFFVGFNFRNPNNTANGGSYNVLRHSKANRHMAGVHTNTNTHHNRIISNQFTDNHVMRTLTPVSVNAYDDIGAWGILLRGNDHEVAYNFFSNNNAWCTFDTPPQGNSVELYEARNNVIHHNTSVNDRDFSELGGSAGIKSDNNAFVYNLVVSSINDSHFIIVRGGGNPFGPTWRTRVMNNTVYYTGAESEGIICGAGCSADILLAQNNIVWAEHKAIFADAPFAEAHNVYWDSQGDPTVQLMNFSMSSTSKIANPRFTDPAARNFRLQSGSPAIDAAKDFGWRKDLDGSATPQGVTVDIGAYEAGSTSAGGTDFQQFLAYLSSHAAWLGGRTAAPTS